MNKLFITNGTIIDIKTGNTFLGTVEIIDSTISAIHKGPFNITGKHTVLDATGKYLIPGLIDMHCHISEKFAPYFVASGVTTVRNTAGNITLLDSLINEPASAPTPRIYSADRMIDGSPGQWGPTSFGNFVTDDVDMARAEVRRQVQAGAKFIKLYGWIKKEVMFAAIDEAQKYNLEVACDGMNSKELSILDFAEAGVTWIEHISGFAQALYPGWHPYVTDDIQQIDWHNTNEQAIQHICEKLLSYNVKLCPTLTIFDQSANYPNHWSPNNYVMASIKNFPSLNEHWKENAKYIETIQDRITVILPLIKKVARMYYEMGGTVVTGTDTPALIDTFPGMSLHRELDLFVEIGFSTFEALQAATINAAKSIKLDDIGEIGVNKIADILILTNNPLDDIKNTQSIEWIIKGGHVYTPAELLTHIPTDEVFNQRLEEFIRKWEATETSQ